MSSGSDADEADAAERALGLASAAPAADEVAAKMDNDAGEALMQAENAEEPSKAAVEGAPPAAELASAPMLLDETAAAREPAAPEPTPAAVPAEAQTASEAPQGEAPAELEAASAPQAEPAAEPIPPAHSLPAPAVPAAEKQMQPVEDSEKGQPSTTALDMERNATELAGAAMMDAEPNVAAMDAEAAMVVKPRATGTVVVASALASDAVADAAEAVAAWGVAATDAASMLAPPARPSSSPTARTATSRVASPDLLSSAAAPASSPAVAAPSVPHTAASSSQTASGSALAPASSTEPPAAATSSAGQTAQSPQHAELLDGLDSQDFDDLMLSPEAARRPAARTGAVLESPAVAARAFQRARSGKQAKQPGAAYDSDDEFAGVDSDLFAELADGDLDASFAGAMGASTSTFSNGAVPPMIGFKSGRGEALKAPSEAALKAARSRFWDVADGEDDVPSTPSRAASAVIGEFAAGARPGNAAGGHLERTRTPLGRLPHDNVSGSPRHSPNESVNGAGKQQAAAAPRAFETPLRTNTLVRPLATPLPRASLSSGATPQRSGSHLLSTPASTSARVALGVTPRVAAARSVARPKFATPFKSAPRAAATVTPRHNTPSSAAFSSPLKTAAGPSHVGLASGRKRMPAADVFKVPAASARAPHSVVGSEQSGRLRKPTVSGGPAVFDLSTPRSERKGMRAYGLHPESVSAAAVKAEFDEIPVILDTPMRSLEFEFDTPAGDAFGPQQALEFLHSKGAVHVDARWIRNHWLLILWKLAALTRLLPDEHAWRFSSEEVCKQLLYR
jgi:breast cancer 2 susceptibility protein